MGIEGGDGVMAPVVLNLYNTESWAVKFTSRFHLMCGTKSRRLLSRSVWKPEPVLTFRGREKFLAFTGIRTVDRPRCSLVAMFAELPCYHIGWVIISKYEEISRTFWERSRSCEKRLLASSRPSVCPSEKNNSASTGRIFIKFDIWGVFRKFAK